MTVTNMEKNLALYQNLRKGLNSKPRLIEYDGFIPISDKNSDWYLSLYQYTDEHKKILEEKGTLSGIQDVTTDKVILDFDDANDIENSRSDALAIATRLVEMGVKEDDIEAFFSGNKGFTLELRLDRRINVQQYKALISKFSDVPTLDVKVTDPQRIFRIPNTKHMKSGLYKVPLELWELDELSLEDIKAIAAKPRYTIKKTKSPVHLPDEYFISTEEKKTITETPVEIQDISSLPPKPKYLDQARWLLVNGFFKEGERSHALLCLASTYKSLGYPKEITYRFLKGVAEVQSRRNNMDRFPDDELYNNIVLQVYGPNWRGGTYSTKDPNSWLFNYSEKMGIKTEEDEENTPIRIHEIGNNFLEYIHNFENNRLYFGLKELDTAFPLCGGSNVGIIGSAGSGKTSLALNLLSNTSKSGALCVFASLDMAKNRLFEKILYRQFNKSREETFNTFKEQREHMQNAVETEFKNVYIFDRSSPNVQSIRDYILSVEQATGDKVKLLMVDYFERVTADSISDDTAASKRVAAELQDLANDFPHLCVVTLYQPNKFSLSGGPETPILSYTSIKGSSFIYQSCRQILSLWRPMYNPATSEHDKFMEMAILKNDLGELGMFQFGWSGKKGSIFELEDHQRDELKQLLEEKKKKKDSSGSGGWE